MYPYSRTNPSRTRGARPEQPSHASQQCRSCCPMIPPRDRASPALPESTPPDAPRRTASPDLPRGDGCDEKIAEGVVAPELRQGGNGAVALMWHFLRERRSRRPIVPVASPLTTCVGRRACSGNYVRRGTSQEKDMESAYSMNFSTTSLHDRTVARLNWEQPRQTKTALQRSDGRRRRL